MQNDEIGSPKVDPAKLAVPNNPIESPPKVFNPAGVEVLPSTNNPQSKPTEAEDGPAPSPTEAAHQADAERSTAPTEPGEGGEGGEEGQAPPFAPSPSFELTNSEFLEAIFCNRPEGARAIVTAKNGDPGQGGWLPHDADRVEAVCKADLNTYVNCASVYPTESGELRAKKEQAAAYHALVLDDVGTKVDRASLPSITPTWDLETSPGNFQVGFALNPPVADPDLVEEAQQIIAEAGLCDKGALGMMRWVRLPDGCNGKPKHAGADGRAFTCRLAAWNPDVTYDLEELVAKLVPDGGRNRSLLPRASVVNAVKAAPTGAISDDVFIPANDENPIVTSLKERGLYKRTIAPGIHDITCPWVDEHTGPDNGAAFFEPSSRYPLGGFKCHHSHGDRYKLKDLLDRVGLTRRDVRNRPVIRVVDGEIMSMVDAAQVVLAETGEYFQSGNAVVKVGHDPITGGILLQCISLDLI